MGGRPGGTVAAAAIVRDHRTAIEYDLLTLTGYTLDDIGGALSWCALFSFIKHLPPSSAYVREMYPEEATWVNGWRNAAILADLWDLIAAAHTAEGRKAPRYPRPTTKKDNTQRLGAEPIAAGDFDRWWNERTTSTGR